MYLPQSRCLARQVSLGIVTTVISAVVSAVRVIDAFVGPLDMARLGFEGVEPKSTGRPGYHPATGRAVPSIRGAPWRVLLRRLRPTSRSAAAASMRLRRASGVEIS